jgi:hypothetical protein
MNAYLKQALVCLALALLVLGCVTPVVSPVGAQQATIFPPTGPFEGLSIQYTISGVTISTTTDGATSSLPMPNGWSRTQTGHVNPGVSAITLTGIASIQSGSGIGGAACSVSIGSGYIPTPMGSSDLYTNNTDLFVGPPTNSTSFSLTVLVPPTTSSGSEITVRIRMWPLEIDRFDVAGGMLSMDGTFTMAGTGSTSSSTLNGAAALPAAAAGIGAATAVAIVGGLGAVGVAAGMMADSGKKDGDDKGTGPIGYILQITKDQLQVAPDQPDSFGAAVYQVSSNGGYLIDDGAEMNVGSGYGITVSPGNAVAQQTFTVSQTGAPKDPEVTLNFKASAGGQTISKEITVKLTKPGLDADTTELNLLAFPDEKVGSAAAPTTAEVKLTLRGVGGEGQWTFELKPSTDSFSGSEAGIVTVSEPKVEGTQATYTIAVADGIEKPTTAGGPNAWRRFVTLHSAASLQTQRIAGPDVKVYVCFEGLYVDKIYTVNERGEYKTDSSKTEVELQVDSPAEDKHSTAKVKFVAMVWEGGTDVQDTPEVVSTLQFLPTWCNEEDCEKWTTIFEVLKANLTFKFNVDAESDPHFQTWSIALDKQVPGKGDRVSGKVLVSSEDGKLSMDLPIVLQLGQPKDPSAMQIDKERARCVRMIDNCIPVDHRQPLSKELDRLQYTGALDYRAFAVRIYDTAWRIWAKDQQDYQYWGDKGWGSYLIEGAEYTAEVGNLVFQLLVGYWATTAAFATGNPQVAFVVGAIGPPLKDEVLAFYAYYVEHDGATRSIKEVGDEYVANNWTRFLQEGATMGVDDYFLKDFNIKSIIANPSGKLLKPFAWLWIWKFTVHLADNFVDGAFEGFVEALIQATKDIWDVAALLLLQEFVNAHGAASNLAASVKVKGWFGGAAPIAAPIAEPAAETPPPKGEPTPPVPGAKPEPTSVAGAEETSAAGAEETSAAGAEDKSGADKTSGADDTGAKPDEPTARGPIKDPLFIETASPPDLTNLHPITKGVLESISKMFDAIPVFRPFGDKYGQIANRNANPKPYEIKAKTMNPLDRLMNFGGKDADLGLVAMKKPPEKMTQKEWEDAGGKKITPEEFEKFQERRDYRENEYNLRKPEVEQLEKEGKIIWDRDTGIIYENKNFGTNDPPERGLGYGGDNDLAAVIDGKTGDSMKGEQLQEYLKKMEDYGITMHGAHLDWNVADGHPGDATVDQNIMADLKGAPGTPGESLAAYTFDPVTGERVWKTYAYVGGEQT